MEKYVKDVINHKDSDNNSLISHTTFSNNIFKAICEYARENNFEITGDGSVINLDYKSNC